MPTQRRSAQSFRRIFASVTVAHPFTVGASIGVARGAARYQRNDRDRSSTFEAAAVARRSLIKLERAITAPHQSTNTAMNVNMATLASCEVASRSNRDGHELADV